MSKSSYKIVLDSMIGYIDCIAELSAYDYELLKRNLNKGTEYYNSVNNHCLPKCHCDFCLRFIVEEIEPIGVKFEMNEHFIVWLVRNLKDIMEDFKIDGTCYDYDLPVETFVPEPDSVGGYDLLEPMD